MLPPLCVQSEVRGSGIEAALVRETHTAGAAPPAAIPVSQILAEQVVLELARDGQTAHDLRAEAAQRATHAPPAQLQQRPRLEGQRTQVVQVLQ